LAVTLEKKGDFGDTFQKYSCIVLRRCVIESPNLFCPNMDCPARGQSNEGNIRIHDRRTGRYRCRVCGKTFVDRSGTMFYRRRTEEDTITRVVTLVSYGCPIPAIEAAFGFQSQPVRAWVDAAGQHAQAVHQAEVVQPRDLQQVQADEMHIKTQAGVVWMAMAIMVSTRLWLGGAVSAHRDRALIGRLTALVAACAKKGPILFVTDGLTTYIDAVRKAFRTRQPVPKGRPRLVVWPELVIAQMVKVKESAGYAVTGTVHRLIHGSVQNFLTLLWGTPDCQVLNTAFIERINGTFRSRFAALGRRTRCPARRAITIELGMYLVGTIYNFCTVHASLSKQAGCKQTPAMAAGITDRIWTVSDLLHYRVRPPQWTPPRQRGRRSRAMQAQIDRWCPDHG
jgi:transposase-like protein